MRWESPTELGLKTLFKDIHGAGSSLEILAGLQIFITSFSSTAFTALKACSGNATGFAAALPVILAVIGREEAHHCWQKMAAAALRAWYAVG